jgi:hypothetical protein
MRQKHRNILPGYFHDDENETRTLKVVLDFREEYKRFDEQLQKYPEILEAAHRDLASLCKSDPTRNRQPDFTTENLFRALLVMQVEAVPYRELVVRTAESRTLQNFCRSATSATTRQKRNDQPYTHLLRVQRPHAGDMGNHQSVFCSAHAARKALELGLGPILPGFRLHPEKIRKLHLDITRFASSKDKQRKQLVKSSYDTLIERTGEVLLKAKQIALQLKMSNNIIAVVLGTELSSYFPASR